MGDFGPSLPPGFKTKDRSPSPTSESQASEDNDCYGPALPPGFQKPQPLSKSSSSGSDPKSTLRTERKAVVGPTLPPHLAAKFGM